MAYDLLGIEALTYTGGGATLLLGARVLYKMIRRDFAEVKESDQKEAIMAHYKDLAERYRQESLDNAKRADAFADERNRTIEELGKLRGETVRLTGHIETLESEVKHQLQTIELMERMCSTPAPNAPHLRRKSGG